LEARREPEKGFCEHRSTGRNCPISKTPCLGECIYANILEEIHLGIIGVDTSRKEIFFQNKLALEIFGMTIRPRDYAALSRCSPEPARAWRRAFPEDPARPALGDRHRISEITCGST
jgi:hypothetical protein